MKTGCHTVPRFGANAVPVSRTIRKRVGMQKGWWALPHATASASLSSFHRPPSERSGPGLGSSSTLISLTVHPATEAAPFTTCSATAFVCP